MMISIGIIYLLYHRRSSRNALRKTFNLPINGDPRWSWIPSSVREYDASLTRPTARLTMKSRVDTGVSALLSRSGDSNIDQIRNWITNIFVRIPESLRMWEIWFGLVSTGLYFYMRGASSGNLSSIVSNPFNNQVRLETEDSMNRDLERRFQEVIHARQTK